MSNHPKVLGGGDHRRLCCASSLVQQFDAYAPLADQPDKHVDGQLTLGENIGDLGGLNAAYDAMQAARRSVRDELQLMLLARDPHAPAQFRVIGAPSNMPAFAQAFGCKAGDPVVRSGDDQVNIW